MILGFLAAAPVRAGVVKTLGIPFSIISSRSQSNQVLIQPKLRS
jgi:hypothetical protein